MIDPESIAYDQLDAIVFDLDGTLYRKPLMKWHMMMGELFHWGMLAAERLSRKRMAGRHFPSEEAFYDAFFEEMAKRHKYTAATARRWYETHYMPMMVHTLRRCYHAEPWALDIIRICKEKGLQVAVYSDYGFVEQKLLALDIDPSLFVFTVCGPQLGGLKPCKESMEEVLRRLGVEAGRCLMIGDRDDTDGGSARAVGAQFRCCK